MFARQATLRLVFTVGAIVTAVHAHAGQRAVRILPAELVPSRSDQTWSLGTVSMSGDGAYSTRVDIPAGATIERVVIYTIDNDPDREIRADFLRSTPSAGKAAGVAHVESTGASSQVRRFSTPATPRYARFGEDDVGLLTVYFEDTDESSKVHFTGAKIVFTEP